MEGEEANALVVMGLVDVPDTIEVSWGDSLKEYSFDHVAWLHKPLLPPALMPDVTCVCLSSPF